MSKTEISQKRVGIVYNSEKERAREEWNRLKKWLQSRHVHVISARQVIPSMKTCDFVVALGGDGTVLHVARSVAPWDVPVLGVNVGRLGFLAATEMGATHRTLSLVLAGKGRVEARSLLSVEATVAGKKRGPFLALNDAVIRSGATGRVLRLQAFVRDRHLANYVGDGLIVATPTGSTAYNLAVYGPLVYPELDVLIISPICPHTLAQRPLVIPTYEVLSVAIGQPSPPAILCLDGEIKFTLGPGDRVTVRRAPEQVQLLMDPDRTFYQVLQTKLKWGDL